MTRRPSGRTSGGRGARAEGARGERSRRGAIFGLLLLGLVGIPTFAWAADPATPHEIVWAHASESTVQRFVVFVSSTKGDASRARRVDVGKPASQASGSLRVFSAIVPIRSDEFVAVAAIDYAGRMGGLSSWSAVPPTRPGQPIVIGP